jgi:sugar phosphate isomerase/epimerase
MSATHQKICATVSLGMPLLPGGHIPLEEKIAALAEAGFTGIDFYMWDLKPYTEQLFDCKLTPEDALCTSHGLQVVSVIGLFQGEGWPKGSEQAIKARASLEKWSLLLKALRTDMLIVSRLNATFE